MAQPAGMESCPPTRHDIARCLRHLIYHALKQANVDCAGSTVDAKLLVFAGHGETDALEIELGANGVGLDSLAMISTASVVSQFFGLEKTGLDDHLLFEEQIGGWSDLIARHFELRGSKVEIAFETSGSTDKPTIVRKSLSDLEDEVGALISAVIPDNIERIVALCPPQHIYGYLFTMLLPTRLGVPVLDCVHAGLGHTRHRLRPNDLVIGTPYIWNRLLNYTGKLPPCVAGVTSGGPSTPALWRSAELSGVASMTEVFGSTETGGLGWRRHGDEAFELMPHLVRLGEGIAGAQTKNLIPLQDHVKWQDGRRFMTVGRLDRAVQIAGVNVSLEKVRDALCHSDEVSDAAVRVDGDRLKAFVVPRSGDFDESELRAVLAHHVRLHLAPPARPTSIVFGEALPRNAMGKLQDW